MKKMAVSFCLAICSICLVAGVAAAQSSGNFSASVDHQVCTLSPSTGTLTVSGCPEGSTCTSLSDPIKIPGGNGTALLVTPSLVTGLYTDTKINSQFTSSTANVGVQVCVQVFPEGSSTALTGAVFGGDSSGCVTYDQRFQSISSGLFSEISACVPTAVTTGSGPVSCTRDSDCTAYATTGETAFCNNPTGGTGTGTCETYSSNCNFELILSTLSAHSYNFIVVPPSSGTYSITATWAVTGQSTSGNASVAACTGPGTLTALQAKVFNNSGSLP